MFSIEGLALLDDKSFMDSFKEWRGWTCVNNEEFCNQVGRLFLPALSCEAYKSLVARGTDICPTTRRRFGPAVSLGTSAAAIKSADYALAKALTKGRAIIAPVHLWGVIAYLAEQGRLPAFAMETYAELIIAQHKVRLETTMVPICFGLLPGEIGFKVPAFAAFWSVLAAPMLLVNGGYNPMINLVWRHAPHFKFMAAMLRIAGIPLPDGAEKNFTINMVFLAVMHMCKREGFSNIVDGMFYEGITGETSNITRLGKKLSEYLKTPPHISISKRLTDITLVEAAHRFFPSEMQKLCGVMSQLEAAKILRFFVKKVHPDLKMPDVDLPVGFNTTVSEARLAFTKLSTVSEHLNICPATCRPSCMVFHDDAWIEWEDYLKRVSSQARVRESLDFSIYESLGKFVDRFGCYPSWNDFAHWLYYSHVMNVKKAVALPECCSQYIDEVLEDFAVVMTTISPDEFTSRRAAAMRREDRKRIERE
jgi:hypothetical protein